MSDFRVYFLTKNIRAVCHKEIIRPYCLMAKDREKSTESLPIGEQEISVENSVENGDQNIGKDPMFSKTIYLVNLVKLGARIHSLSPNIQRVNSIKSDKNLLSAQF